jgi:hypothetical protein
MVYNCNITRPLAPRFLACFLILGVRIMAKSPAEVLRKTKQADKKKDSDDKGKPKRNALLSFIAANKKC